MQFFHMQHLMQHFFPDFHWKCTAIGIKWAVIDWQILDQFDRSRKVEKYDPEKEAKDMYVHILWMITWSFFKNIILNTSRLRLWEISETA